MTLALLVRLIYPRAQCPADYVVSDNDGVQIISRWNVDTLGPQPTLEELHTKAQSAEFKTARLSAARRAAYRAAWTDDDLQEAILENASGNAAKLSAILAKRTAIRLQGEALLNE